VTGRSDSGTLQATARGLCRVSTQSEESGGKSLAPKRRNEMSHSTCYHPRGLPRSLRTTTPPELELLVTSLLFESRKPKEGQSQRCVAGC
jgi:hypothetical protein